MLDTSSSEVQLSASKCPRLGGSSGKLSRLVSDKSNLYNEDNPWRSFSFTGLSPMAENKFFTTRFERSQISSPQ
ncbi:hypothetical protein V6Z12_A11G326500 [Gossypium hirsutum]